MRGQLKEKLNQPFNKKNTNKKNLLKIASNN